LSNNDIFQLTVLEPELPKDGEEPTSVKLNKDHNLEWLVQIPANEKRELVIKWKVEHPAHEKIEFHDA
jgi:hypothetical protein